MFDVIVAERCHALVFSLFVDLLAVRQYALVCAIMRFVEFMYKRRRQVRDAGEWHGLRDAIVVDCERVVNDTHYSIESAVVRL